MIGGFATFADFLSFIPVVGSLFLLMFWGIFKFKGLSAPFPFGSMFIKVIPLVSLVPVCSAYVWRVYWRNQQSGLFNEIKDVAKPTTAIKAGFAVATSAPKEKAQGAK